MVYQQNFYQAHWVPYTDLMNIHEHVLDRLVMTIPLGGLHNFSIVSVAIHFWIALWRGIFSPNFTAETSTGGLCHGSF